MSLSQLIYRYLGFSLAVLIAVLALGISVGAEAPFYWDAIDVDIAVQQNSDLWITETQTYVFTGNHTRERYHPGPRPKPLGTLLPGALPSGRSGETLPTLVRVGGGGLTVRALKPVILSTYSSIYTKFCSPLARLLSSEFWYQLTRAPW